MAAKRKPVSRDAKLAELQKRADSYAQLLRDKLRRAGISVEALQEIDPLITEFSRLMIAVAAHLDGEK